MTNEHLHCQTVPCQPSLGSHSALFFAQFFSPIREHLNYATFHSEEKTSVGEKWALLKSCSCHHICGHVWSLLTYFCSWWLTSELILKDSRRQKVPTSTAATEIRTKPFLSLTTHMISCLSYNLHNSTPTAAGSITHIIGSWKYDKITVVQGTPQLLPRNGEHTQSVCGLREGN